MNGGDFKVTPQQLQQNSASLRGQATELLSQLDQFNKDVAARSATWEGAAKESYTQKHGQWTEGMNQMQQALQAFADLVDQLAGNYVATDNSGANTFQGMSIGR